MLAVRRDTVRRSGPAQLKLGQTSGTPATMRPVALDVSMPSRSDFCTIPRSKLADGRHYLGSVAAGGRANNHNGVTCRA